MYRMLYNDNFLFDPFDETRIVSSASITTNVNAASYLDFTIAANHPLYNEIEQRSGIITLYSDNEKLFQGLITAIDIDMDGNKSVSCSSALDWLRDVQLRPYSTDQAECDEYEFKLDKAPDALDAYFQWLIDQYNAQNKDGRYFTINVNQAADLTRQSLVYFASTSPRSVADAIEDDILGTFGGYLVLRYEDDQLILDLYSDIHEMNEQVIDYGENILDISRSESTDDQYTAVYPIGKTPQYTAEQQKYHDEKAIFDEYMKQRDATEKAAIAQLQKEEEAEQNRINGMANGQAKKNAENALKKRKDQRQDREKAFSDETKLLQDAQKIKDDKNAADKTKPNPITIESLDNGGYPGDLDIFKEGDVVYSVSYVQRYGYKEFVYNDTNIEDKQLLLALAVAKLKSLLAPSLTIDVRAVDQALYNPKHTHLFAGQAVRVRSKPHGVDEFMMVSSIDLDLIDPSRTTATLGVAYDTLTGQQSSFLRNLNSKVVASVDAVDKLGKDVKVTEIALGRVETVVDNVAADNELIVNTFGDYKWMTDAAWGKAEDAQESAEEANRGVTDTNCRIDNIKTETDERIDAMETDISGIHDGIGDIEKNYASKVYVDQTSESVSIGVVEDFKDGKHGDKLTTQSNLTAMKEEINLSVSKQYADLSDQIKLGNPDNGIGKNFSFESNNFDGWASHDNWAIGSNGAHTGRYYAHITIPAGSNGKQLISTGSISAEYGHTYKLEYWVKKKPNTQCRGIHRISYKRSGRWEDTPSDVATTIFLDENGTTNITGGRDYFDVTDSWMKVTTYIIPPSNVTDIRVRIIGNNPGSAQTVYAVDDVSLTDYSVAKTINKTMAGISVKADSIVQEVRNDYATKDLVSRSIPGLKNPNFDAYKEGYTAITGWSVLGPWAEKKLGNTSPVSKSEGGTYFAGRSGTTAGQTLELINEGYISAYPGMKVQISWWMFVDANIIQNSNFSAGIIANGVVTRNLLSNYSTGGWKYMTTTVEVPANVNQFRVRFGFVTTGTAGWLRLDSVSVTDVTEAKAALGKATTVEANLENYKITVSDTYADNDTVKKMQTQWKQTAEGFEASIKASGSSISVVNPGFETGDTTGWTATNFKDISVPDGALFQNTTHRFLGYRDGSVGYKMPILANEGTVTARKNDYIKVSARILFLDESNNSLGGWLSIGVMNAYSGIVHLGDVDITSGGWNTISYNVQVPDDGLYSVWLVFPSTIDESTKILVDDVTMANETEAVHADSRINTLETRIAMTSEGVRVGKIENGTFKGTSALMNSEGSFDILQGEETVSTMRSDYVGLMRDFDTDKYRFGIRPYEEHSAGYEGVDLQTVGGFSLNGIPAAPASDILSIRGTQTGNNYFVKYNVDTLKNDNVKFTDAATLRHDYYQRLDEGKPALAAHFKHAVGATTTKDGDTNVSDTQVMALNPCLYGIQFVVNANKKTAASYLDAKVKVMKTGESTWIESSALPAFRVIEVGDPTGWLTRTSPMYFVKLDVGYRFGIYISGSTSDFTIGGLNKIIITRMPFSGERMN